MTRPPKSPLIDNTPTVIHLNGKEDNKGRVAAVYRCKIPFMDLQNTADPDVKHCPQCERKVFLVTDYDGIERAVAAKCCVWGPVDIRYPNNDPRQNYFGFPATSIDTSRLKWDE